MKVQQREEEEEIPDNEATEAAVDGEQKTKIVIKMVDEDQQGRALAVICRNPPGLKDEFVYQINAYAGKAHRENFIEYIHS